MDALDFRALKMAAHELVEPQQRSAGRTAVCYVLILNILQLILNALSARYIQLPDYETTEELLQYFMEGHTDTLMKMMAFSLVTVGISLLFSGVFSAYSLRITDGQPANGRTLLGCLGLLFRYLLFFVLLVAAAFVLSLVFSLLMTLAAPLAVILLFALCIGTVLLFYVLRLVLFSVADREDCRVLSAARDCARITKGHKKELFLLDVSFLWFVILITVISTVISMLPDAVLSIAAKAGNEALVSWFSANYGIVSLVGSFLGVLATLPLFYKFYTKIQVTYALAYRKLKELPEQSEGTQPLAYMEFSDPQE